MKKVLLLLLLITCCHLLTGAVKLELVKTVGDEREDYTFFIPTGAAMSENKDIFVLDAQGIFVAKYDWEGKFIKRTGQQGQGPKDFFFPRSLIYFNGHITILDEGNHRIAIMNDNLENPEYVLFGTAGRFQDKCLELNNDRYIGAYSQFNDKGRIGIINKKGEIVNRFFDHFPIAVNPPDDNENIDNQVKRFMINDETKPQLGVDPNNGIVLTSFRKPDNPIKFFVYNDEGKPLKEFEYTIKEKKYKLCDFYIKATKADIMNKRGPKVKFIPKITSLYVHNGHYIAALWLEDHKLDKVEKRRSFLLVFDDQGKVKGELELEDEFKVFSISPQGYLLGTNIEEDISKIYIYKLSL